MGQNTDICLSETRKWLKQLKWNLKPTIRISWLENILNEVLSEVQIVVLYNDRTENTFHVLEIDGQSGIVEGIIGGQNG